jgi:DNA modification methylase
VLDPFNGTGQTSIAALKKGRDFIGIEISERYAKDSIKRIAKYAGARL